MKKDLIEKLKKGNFVFLKVSVRDFVQVRTVLEITNSAGKLLYSENFDYVDMNKAIQVAQLKMVQLAGEYQNKGAFAIINPFTN